MNIVLNFLCFFRHEGNYGFISEEASSVSVYRLIEAYYKRVDMRFGGEGLPDESFLLPRTMAKGTGVHR